MWNWCKRWLPGRRRKTPRPRPASTIQKRRYRLQMEALEDRMAPASLLPNASPIPAAATTPAPLASPNPSSTVPGTVAAPAGSPQTSGVNLIIPTLAQGQTSSAFGFNSPALAGFPFFASAVIQNPDVATSLFQGTTSLLNFTTRFIGVERVGAGTAVLFFQLVNPTQLFSAALGHLNVVPTGSQNPVNYLTPSSGSAALQPVPLAPVPTLPSPLLPLGPQTQLPHSGTNAASAITGVVFRDLNSNGIQDRNEPGMAGVRLVLESQKDQRFQVISTTVTDARGRYAFPHLPAGVYRVRPEAPAGYQAEQASRSVTVAPSAKALDQNFGLTPRKKPEKPLRAQPAAKPQSALPSRPAALDRVFAGWDGDSLLGNPLVDQVFATNEEHSSCAEASMLVGAAAAFAEFNLFPGAERFWESDDKSWREDE